ncbi:prenyltransferase/squalene oxidase repeat-containing protein [Lentzea sp. BCCO 10_0856]|uniref:Prenyltransferase/squalene oxidase repeat-containing protein n=1 Tax=Lentzea miocenica TaxID=3095431 RepID=A0ABU4T4I5_9PSEU|nr:prenyltransferase/squalene oxidase repeat-containing protein [Lentzea sp. BCCO 10_0856]MDX8032858.1 prenyltransferase/squalene oxidase repeat-containing protein [Lentzea sp. BCCO 10_0856]
MRRTSVLVAIIAAALVATPRAQAAEAPAAGTWLASQFAGGDHLLKGPDLVDPGLTADGVYALAAAGVGKSTATKAAAWLAQPEQLAFLVGDGEAESYVGGLAKLALVAQTLGTDPHKFAGVDLLARLSALQEESGRYRDKTDPEWDQTNAFTQALAIIVLKRAALPFDKGLAYQVSTQCPDGGFPIAFGQPTCRSDVDGTAMVLQALLAVGEKSAAPKALAWLVAQQKADGGFPSATAGANANSTGLAVGALVAGGRAEVADKAVAYLKSLQVGCAGPEAQRGAVSYDSTGFELYPAVRATTQAMLGLARVSLADVSASSASAGVPAIDCTTTPSPSPTVPAPAGPGTPADPPLAVTGPDQVVPLTLFGSFAVLAGAVLLVVSRRRKVGA